MWDGRTETIIIIISPPLFQRVIITHERDENRGMYIEK